MSECSQNSCMSGSSQSANLGCGSGKCGCSSKCECQCQCSNCSCKNYNGGCHQGKYSDQLFKLADDAWMELLKEKIKEEIRLNGGEQIAQLAKLVSTANHARWKDKMQTKKDHEEFENNLKAAMGCPSKK